jgi:hypothetical protein
MFFAQSIAVSPSDAEAPALRMLAFHRQQIELICSAESPHSLTDKRILVVHLIPLSAVRDEIHLTGAALKELARTFPPLGDTGGHKRFNADGYLINDGKTNLRSYSQLFRNGCVEAAMAEVTYSRPNGGSLQLFRDNICEMAVFEIVKHYLKFCIAAEISAPIRMYSALLGCKGVHFCTHWGAYDASEHPIDRSPVFLPSLEITDLAADVTATCRPWCDSLAQAAGLERSQNFDANGIWHERRRSY